MAKLEVGKGRASGENLERLRRFDEDGKPKSVFLTDTDFLNCPICYEPLTPPVFQCQNGHIACSLCYPKLKKKCSFCRSVNGFIRNRAIEKALESAKLLCPNSKYGCEETLTYNRSHHHKCRYEPCSCPLPGCKFAAESSQLYKHFSDEHKKFALQFQFNTVFKVGVYANDYFIILQEEKHGHLFILKRTVHNPDWNKVSVFCIGSPSDEKGSFGCKLEVIHDTGRTIMSFPSSPVSSRNKDYDKAEPVAFTFSVVSYERPFKLYLSINLFVVPSGDSV